MSKEIAKPNGRPGSWSMLRRHLVTLDQPSLLSLVKDLYELSAANRDFIQARCQAGESDGKMLEKYRGKIVEQFYPARGEAKLKLVCSTLSRRSLNHRPTAFRILARWCQLCLNA